MWCSCPINYKKLMQIVRSTTLSDWLHHDIKGGIYTLKSDLNIRIERQDSPYESGFNEAWATNHPDPSTSKELYGAYYGASLVEQFTLISVDGGRALLPMPRPGTNKIPRAIYQLAKAIDEGTLDDYIHRSDLIVEE